ncbi:L-type lectin-domain containing receptor kinase IV.2 [Dichanthelium oligosanthes]|uniref:non-specific serine/threonine protein kinase n=1 Tax=Dichanthelium oligosanthes TaxID=888268 RepID=A0A1E5UIM7_9POAL|nr:L-type lectin-domain containing receptor kinase IV.2 [Dichanthelium oligosanthes]
MLLLVLLLFCTRSLPVRSSSDQFVYNGFTGANLAVDDSSFVTSDGLLVLTNGTNRLKGHATYPSLLHFRNKSPNSSIHVLSSFSTTFVFAILSEYTDLSGYGIALFIAAAKNFSTTLSYEYMGLFNIESNGNASNHIFAVELDTIRNVNMGDIDSNHVGIDINGLKSVKAASAGYYDDKGNGVFRNLTMISGEVMQVWVDYDAKRAELNVTLAPAQVPKPKKPLLSHQVDLSTVITEWAYVGFSSSLGDMSSRHCILGWSFALNGSATPLSYTKLPKLPKARPSSHMVLSVVLPLAIVMFILTVVGAVFFLVRRRIKYAELQESWEDEFRPHRFSYKVLFHATNGFSDDKLLGAGGFGRVYKGTLPAHKLEIAVKKVSHDSRQGIKEFIAEITSIGRLEHKNLVRLLGYCRRKHELLLVYEYLSNGSLDKHLHNHEMDRTLVWDTRFHIIKGVSLGLSYLHDNCEKVVIHRDIKASNVLLDAEMNGRLGDFGLARLYDHGTDPLTTHVVGTIGYLAPELARTSKSTPLTDVFSFGMFLLEVACGRRPVLLDDTQDSHVCWLVDWVLEHWGKGDLIGSMDKRLGGNYDIDQASLVLKVGLLCSRPSPCSRPVMRQVVQYLEGSMPLPDMSPTSPNFGTLALLQSDGFEAYDMPFSVSSKTSCILESDCLSGGR